MNRNVKYRSFDRNAMLEFKFEVRHFWPNNSFQRTLTPAGFGPLNSKR